MTNQKMIENLREYEAATKRRETAKYKDAQNATSDISRECALAQALTYGNVAGDIRRMIADLHQDQEMADAAVFGLEGAERDWEQWKREAEVT